MQLIYSNFDKLEITFQGILPEKILNQLAGAREQAQNEKREVPMEIGRSKKTVLVAETGARGGYRYRFDTGPDGETWLISHSTNSETWGIRVTVKSLSLALYGYEECKRRILNYLDDWEATGLSRHDENGTVINTPLERISRFDYCFDFIIPHDFYPMPNNFVAHRRTKIQIMGKDDSEISKMQTLSGGKIETLTLGKSPGRQATLYNKSKEIKSSLKREWWQIWNLDPNNFKDKAKNIWRVEVRAGKKELDKWGFKRFKDFEEKAGDVTASILKAMRYTIPLKDDLNRSRWPMHPIWKEALNESFKVLKPYSSNAIRENIVDGMREEKLQIYRRQIIGCLISMTALKGLDMSEIPAAMLSIEKSIEELAKEDKDGLIGKFQKAKDKFRLLEN